MLYEGKGLHTRAGADACWSWPRGGDGSCLPIDCRFRCRPVALFWDGRLKETKSQPLRSELIASSKQESLVWFISLADIVDAKQIYSAICDVVLPSEERNPDPLTQLVRALEASPSLLILDNFEHLADEAAHILYPLLERASTLKLLVTSRRILDITGEVQCEIVPLSTPKRGGSPQRCSWSFRAFSYLWTAFDPGMQTLP